MGCCNTITKCLIVTTINPIWHSHPVHPGPKFLTIVALKASGYLLAAVNSADSTEFTGTFTIPHLDNEYTNQTHSLCNILFRISR